VHQVGCVDYVITSLRCTVNKTLNSNTISLYFALNYETVYLFQANTPILGSEKRKEYIIVQVMQADRFNEELIRCMNGGLYSTHVLYISLGFTFRFVFENTGHCY
jgi:hypothetical protein